MRYLYFDKALLAIMLITLPVYAFSQCKDCSRDACSRDTCSRDACSRDVCASDVCTSDVCASDDSASDVSAPDEQERNLQNIPTCDTYVTDSMSSVTFQSAEHKITKQVQDLLANESDLPDITVTTANGVVFLTGTAINEAQVNKAASLAATVPCVTDVDTSKFYVQ